MSYYQHNHLQACSAKPVDGVDSTLDGVKDAVEEEVVQRVEEQIQETTEGTTEQINSVKEKFKSIANKPEENK